MNLSAEERQKQKDDYLGSHYYIESIMISGDDIAKAEIGKR
jgi:hypothetical protein